jgi:hypothetical protein
MAHTLTLQFLVPLLQLRQPRFALAAAASSKFNVDLTTI